jgi:hypothetical protein
MPDETAQGGSPMNKLTFYEQVGIVIPGSALLVGLLFYFPGLNALMAKNGVTLGQFGIFLLLSYAAGHFVAAIGNALESLFWRIFGGMPSDWVIRPAGTSLLSAQQITLLENRIRDRLKIQVGNLKGLDPNVWWPISREIYADVAKNGKQDRIDTFNGNYGLTRGLAASGFLLAIVAFAHGQRGVAAGLLILSVIFGYRAYLFGVLYAREMYVQFLLTTDKPPTPPTPPPAAS